MAARAGIVAPINEAYHVARHLARWRCFEVYLEFAYAARNDLHGLGSRAIPTNCVNTPSHSGTKSLELECSRCLFKPKDVSITSAARDPSSYRDFETSPGKADFEGGMHLRTLSSCEPEPLAMPHECRKTTCNYGLTAQLPQVSTQRFA